ncbi:hypothetical protein [Sulfuricurvum sp.]|uniref:hypothetical protein n=1 Tax=Sulfuricurvum sp. TaxID=2025608 RepID=UPI00356A551B
MKTESYRLVKEMEHINPTNVDWFKHQIRGILESQKPFHVKCDYIGLSFQEIDEKIEFLASQIKEIQTMKKSLESAKSIALEAVASVLGEYGVDRIDGTMISSITITPSKTKIKNTLTILDANALISLGYVNVTIDEKSIMEAMCTIEGMEEVDQYVEMIVTEEHIPSHIKVNTKRSSANNQATELLKYTEDAA